MVMQALYTTLKNLQPFVLFLFLFLIWEHIIIYTLLDDNKKLHQLTTNGFRYL